MSGFLSRNRPARRRSRNLKVSLEPLFQFRYELTADEIADGAEYHRHEGVVRPASHLLGRTTGIGLTINNPAYLNITPAFQADGTPLDIIRGDLFIRLKYINGEDTTDQEAIDFATDTRAKYSLQVVTFEIADNIFRILGDLA